jgi:phospholipase C
MHATPYRLRSAAASALLLVAGCRGAGVSGTSYALPPAASERADTPDGPAKGFDKIQHVVIIIQENRSFNDLFMGFPNAKTASYGYDTKKQKITLQAVSLATKWDLEHNSQAFIAGCNGTGSIPGTDCKMNGFNNVTAQCSTPGFPKCPIKYPPYSYVPQSEIAPYWSMAKQYALADEMYASNFDVSSFISHQYIIAAQADSAINYPTANWGCPGVGTGKKGKDADTIYTIKKNPARAYGPQIPVCFNYPTLGDELDAKGLSWAFYAAQLSGTHTGKPCGKSSENPDYTETNGIWSAYQAVKHICYGADWDKDVITPQTQFFTDVKAGNLRDVTWIVPTETNSDHPGSDSDTGPSWVASLVNAIGESQFWKSTAIFIFWDDPGGFFDPEAPQYLDYDGLGFRIPLLIVSPYVHAGLVSHTHYEHGSILRFIEDRYGLAQLAASDSRAADPEKYVFNFHQKPIKFVPISSKYDREYFLRQPPDYRPPDTN